MKRKAMERMIEGWNYLYIKYTESKQLVLLKTVIKVDLFQKCWKDLKRIVRA